MEPLDEFAAVVQALIERISRSQSANIACAAELVTNVVARDGIVYTFGSGHSSLVATEFYYRAGGMACYDVIPDRAFGKAELLEGYAAALLEAHPLGAQDALIVISNSGRNPLPIEMALEARRRGAKTIGITALDHSRHVDSRHSSGQKLYMVCDVVIDTCVPLGDAVVDLGGNTKRVGAVSTIAGAFIASSITVRAAECCLKRGLDPKLFVSSNTNDGRERNRELLEFVKMRTRGL